MKLEVGPHKDQDAIEVAVSDWSGDVLLFGDAGTVVANVCCLNMLKLLLQMSIFWCCWKRYWSLAGCVVSLYQQRSVSVGIAEVILRRLSEISS